MPGDDGQFVHLRRRRWVRGWRIFETAGLALSPASVLLAAAAVFLLALLNSLINLAVPAGEVVQISLTIESTSGISEAAQWLERSKPESLFEPWHHMIGSVGHMLAPASEGLSRANAGVRFLVGLAIWSLVGLVLCRRSALIFAGNDQSTFLQAIKYSLRRWTHCAGAPLIPLAAAAVLGLMLALAGLLGRIPLVGSAWLFVGSPLFVVIGFGIAFLLLVTAIGWPLMVAAIATDDCDSFGALSRSYSGLTGRPWLVAGYGLLGAVIGLILMFAVTWFGRTMIWCTMACVSAGSGQEPAAETLFPPLRFIVDGLVQAVGVSFFWSLSTVVYLLMRQEVDGVPLYRVAADDESRPVRDPLPVVGIPATDARTEPQVETPGEADAGSTEHVQ